jgi:hypothetical protein
MNALRRISTLSLCALVVGAFGTRSAQAIPAFAAQTGLPCSTCHIGFPQLTPFGRIFKMEAYDLGELNTPDAKNYAAMVQAGFTHLKDKVPGGMSSDYPSNNAWSIQQTSLFFGGVLDKNLGLGAFVQGTFDGVAHQFHWDNVDIRWHDDTRLFGDPLIYGVSFNNNPAVTDLWNTLPAWGYPYVPSGLAPGPTAGLQIASLGQSVAGVGLYGALNLTSADLAYAEFDLYKALPNHTAYMLGVGPEAPVDGVIPYWRLAYQHNEGANSIEVGTSGLEDQLYPSGFSHGATDSMLDIGFDAQFQHITPTQALSLQLSYFHEYQHWGASYALGNTQNLNDGLDQESVTLSYLWHQMLGATESYTVTTGKGDTGLYNVSTANANGKPNTASLTTELDYYPFNQGGPAFLPWANAKIFVEDTYYPYFNGLAHNYDGAGRSASGNDTVFTGIWLVF